MGFVRRLTSIGLALLLACADPGVNDPGPVLRISPPDEVELAVGQSVDVSLAGGGSVDLTVTFEAVLSDSRCPSNVVCIWQGDASVRLRLAGDATGDLVLHTPSTTMGPRTGVAGRFQVELLNLSPDPDTSRPRPAAHRLTLRITLAN